MVNVFAGHACLAGGCCYLAPSVQELMRRADGSETGTRRAPTIETSLPARSPNLPYATPNARSPSAHRHPPTPAHVQRSLPPCTAKPGKSRLLRSLHPSNLSVPADNLRISSSPTPTYRTFPSHTFIAAPPSTETPRDTTTMDGAVRPTLGARSASSVRSASHSLYSAWSEGKMPSQWRHTLGIALLLVTVVLWTASNFLASTIFADDTYSKPYFVTYVNTAFFVIPLGPILFKQARRDPEQFRQLADAVKRPFRRSGKSTYAPVKEQEDGAEREAFLGQQSEDAGSGDVEAGEASQTLSVEIGDPQMDSTEGLTFVDTAKLSFEFSILWFLANYFTAACLEYTTVASSTILTSTSSIWTLLTGAFIGVEHFTIRKLLGVLASLAGIVLISTVDISGTNNSDENRGSFPSKTQGEIALGDSLAFLSAVMYGFYAVLMKKRIEDESRVNMPLFFGLVGLFNIAMLWPGFILLDMTGIETFELPPNGRVTAIVLINSATSMVSDMCWAYAMLLTGSPLVVTVGLSMTIPCSLIGQILINGQTSHWAYWIGAAIVLASFVFVNYEEVKEEEQEAVDAATVFPREVGRIG